MAFGRRLQKIESDEPIVVAEQDDSQISLEDLGKAYAQAIRQESVPSNPDTRPSDADDRNVQESLEAPEVGESDGIPVTTEGVIEALLFVGGPESKSLGVDRILSLFQGMTPHDLEEIIDRLNSRYRKHRRAFEIIAERGGYRIQLIPEIASVREKFYTKARETQLQQTAIDCLALVAYNPGISRDEVEKLWGNPPGSTLNFLVRKGLLRVEKVGSVMKYFTTERFLEIAGLESLEDLPREDL